VDIRQPFNRGISRQQIGLHLAKHLQIALRRSFQFGLVQVSDFNGRAVCMAMAFSNEVSGGELFIWIAHHNNGTQGALFGFKARRAMR
jgi:hypothetical protein